jgi:hypothetical protein
MSGFRWLTVVALVGTSGCRFDLPARPDGAPEDAPCASQTYYRDTDGDGHGDPAAPIEGECEVPAGAVASGDDCDDGDAQRSPGLPEVCDGVDNDCNAATAEMCPADCTLARRPPPDDARHVYLLCNIAANWTTAQLFCAGAMYKLAQIESAAENAFLRSAATAAYGTISFHIGATDSAIEGSWVWDAGEPFWQGADNGAPVGGRYANWNTNEPNNGNSINDCARMKGDGTWEAVNCDNNHRFACRR